MNKRFVIAAPRSNAGKTTVTLGLLRLLKRKGIDIRPFKSGPDYIDPKFHELATGYCGVNLDLFMMSQQEIETTLSNFSEEDSIQCIEGVMGLFDGANKSNGSTAELAKKIGAPVILVVDAKAIAYSVAPLIQGFFNFDANLSIAGVIFNRVGSERHFHILKEACKDINVPVLGYLKKVDGAEIPSRHLGLNIDDIQSFDKAVDRIADEIEHNVNWKQILDLAHVAHKVIKRTNFSFRKKLKFAVAKDEAFNFIYPQLIQAMLLLGEVTYFSPLEDTSLPLADFVYIPGGYPEIYLNKLTANKSMLASIHAYASNQGKIFAECGGMMYLGNEIIDKAGHGHKMVGYFNFSTSIKKPKLHLGYRTVHVREQIFKGHEFHYSTLENNKEQNTIGKIKNVKGDVVETLLFHKQHVLASYMHFYIGSAKQLKDLNSLMLNHAK